MWVFRDDDSFDRDVYKLIDQSKTMLDTRTKERIFHLTKGVDKIDERQYIVQEWEKAMKGGGIKRSLQSFWAFHWCAPAAVHHSHLPIREPRSTGAGG